MNNAALQQRNPIQQASFSGPSRRIFPGWLSTTLGRTPLALSLIVLVLGLVGVALNMVGFQYVSTRGHSMEPTMSSGSLLLTRQTAPKDIHVGDVIAFQGTIEGVPNIVHRVVSLQDDGQTRVAVTQGDNNPVPDPGLLTLDKSVDRVVLILPHVGWWVTPALGWYLLAFGALLGVRVVFRWGSCWIAGRRANATSSVMLMDGVSAG